MNTKGREIIGSCESKMLIADSSMKVDTVLVILAKTDTEVKLQRGAVLAMVGDTGKCRLLSGAEDETAAYILAEDIATSKTGDIAAEAYQTGKFVRNTLTVAESYTLSVKDEKALRNAGIYLENAIM
ncbi:MAG: head decoration protein [Bacillus sp. (in: Bacteria)]|nr:head decoration protein [Bacillus sp. (in: firmicutes)]MCM1427121.1 head decoration protein [Eubacterium sp.]